MSKPATLHAKISKAFRRRGPGARQFYVTARRATRFFKDAPRRTALGALSATDIQITQERGFVVIPPGRFDEVPAIVTDARATLAAFDAHSPPRSKKRFLRDVLDPETLTLDTAVMRFALRPDVLAAVSRYLGVVPFLSTISVFHSDATEGAPTSSQLFHCDGDDVTQVKIFVYCTDVDAASGPLTLLDAQTTREVQERTRYEFRDRLSDQKVQRVKTAKEHAILGPTGTTVFVDTSRCFHFGSRVAPNAPPRLVTMLQYQTPYAFTLPADPEPSLPFRRLLDPSLTQLQRLVLGE